MANIWFHRISLESLQKRPLVAAPVWISTSTTKTLYIDQTLSEQSHHHLQTQRMTLELSTGSSELPPKSSLMSEGDHPRDAPLKCRILASRRPSQHSSGLPLVPSLVNNQTRQSRDEADQGRELAQRTRYAARVLADPTPEPVHAACAAC